MATNLFTSLRNLVTEDNLKLARGSTVVHERRAIVSISKRCGTSVLEKLRKGISPTGGQDISPAPDDGAKAFAFVWGHCHGNVKTVHEAHFVGREVFVATVVEAELCQCDGGGSTEAIALNAVATIARLAGEMSVGVGAAGSSPDTAGPVGCGCGEGTVGEGVKDEAASFEDRLTGVRLDSGINGERTVVNDC
ncbi:hypothetical protein V6N12_073470 [Hibiscus sabdariffa]|uniref:Uncharacterized protein n=1 Tax=Hibiscus sabdariffa TaxID=183260 RepID=A0ABR2AMV0_9ROSI